MGKDFLQGYQWETWKLVLLVGLMFAVIITFQYLELPYGSIQSSLSSTQKILGQGESSISRDGLSSKTDMINNLTQLNDMDSIIPHGAPDRDYGLNESSVIDNDKGSSPGQVLGPSDALSSKPEMLSNVTQLDDVNSTIPNGTPVRNNDQVREKDADEKNDFLSESNAGLSRSFEIGNHKRSSPGLVLGPSISSTVDPVNISGNRYAPEETEQSFSQENITFSSETARNPDADNATIAPAAPPLSSSPKISLPRLESPATPIDPGIAALDKDASARLDKGKTGELKNNITSLHDNSFPATVPELKKKPVMPMPDVLSLSDMKFLLHQSWSSPSVKKPKWSSAVDKELLHAKSEIENAPILENDPILYAPLYQNVSMFKRSYELMEEILKVYIYKEGDKPILHQPPLQGIYASEGWFLKLMESNKKFVTRNPRKAHLFYLPFSSRNLEEALYVPNSHSHTNLIQFLNDYVDMIAAKYAFWNRTEGTDHFLVACHDWAPQETKQRMNNCIRALCNSDVKEGFVFGKDVSLPETYVRSPQHLLRDLGGKPPSKRSILAFFAGNMHGYLREILLKHWGNKDPDMRIYGPMPNVKGKMNYIQHMKSSKYCICAKGYEVNSPRVVEAIFYECVPVIISDNFIPPFFEVLNWESFAVFVAEKDIPNLKNILLSIPQKKYLRLQMRVKKVQQHFLWHTKPVKYDLFHMILHSVWYNRVFQMWP